MYAENNIHFQQSQGAQAHKSFIKQVSPPPPGHAEWSSLGGGISGFMQSQQPTNYSTNGISSQQHPFTLKNQNVLGRDTGMMFSQNQVGAPVNNTKYERNSIFTNNNVVEALNENQTTPATKHKKFKIPPPLARNQNWTTNFDDKLFDTEIKNQNGVVDAETPDKFNDEDPFRKQQQNQQFQAQNRSMDPPLSRNNQNTNKQYFSQNVVEDNQSPLKYAGINILNAAATVEPNPKRKIFGSQPKLPLNSLPQLNENNQEYGEGSGLTSIQPPQADNERSSEQYHILQKKKMERKLKKSMKLAAKYEEQHQSYAPSHLMEDKFSVSNTSPPYKQPQSNSRLTEFKNNEVFPNYESSDDLQTLPNTDQQNRVNTIPQSRASNAYFTKSNVSASASVQGNEVVMLNRDGMKSRNTNKRSNGNLRSIPQLQNIGASSILGSMPITTTNQLKTSSMPPNINLQILDSASITQPSDQESTKKVHITKVRRKIIDASNERLSQVSSTNKNLVDRAELDNHTEFMKDQSIAELAERVKALTSMHLSQSQDAGSGRNGVPKSQTVANISIPNQAQLQSYAQSVSPQIIQPQNILGTSYKKKKKKETVEGEQDFQSPLPPLPKMKVIIPALPDIHMESQLMKTSFLAGGGFKSPPKPQIPHFLQDSMPSHQKFSTIGTTSMGNEIGGIKSQALQDQQEFQAEEHIQLFKVKKLHKKKKQESSYQQQYQQRLTEEVLQRAFNNVKQEANQQAIGIFEKSQRTSLEGEPSETTKTPQKMTKEQARKMLRQKRKDLDPTIIAKVLQQAQLQQSQEKASGVFFESLDGQNNVNIDTNAYSSMLDVNAFEAGSPGIQGVHVKNNQTFETISQSPMPFETSRSLRFRERLKTFMQQVEQTPEIANFIKLDPSLKVISGNLGQKPSEQQSNGIKFCDVILKIPLSAQEINDEDENAAQIDEIFVQKVKEILTFLDNQAVQRNTKNNSNIPTAKYSSANIQQSLLINTVPLANPNTIATYYEPSGTLKSLIRKAQGGGNLEASNQENTSIPKMRTSSTGLLSVSMAVTNPTKQLQFADEHIGIPNHKRRISRAPSARQQILETIQSEGMSSSQDSFTPIGNQSLSSNSPQLTKKHTTDTKQHYMMQPTFESHSHSMVAGLNTSNAEPMRENQLPCKKKRLQSMNMPTLKFPQHIEGGLALKTQKCSEGSSRSQDDTQQQEEQIRISDQEPTSTRKKRHENTQDSIRMKQSPNEYYYTGGEGVNKSGNNPFKKQTFNTGPSVNINSFGNSFKQNLAANNALKQSLHMFSDKDSLVNTNNSAQIFLRDEKIRKLLEQLSLEILSSMISNNNPNRSNTLPHEMSMMPQNGKFSVNNMSEIGMSDGINSPMLEGEDMQIMQKLQIALKQLQETNHLKEALQMQEQQQEQDQMSHLRVNMQQVNLNKTSMAVANSHSNLPMVLGDKLKYISQQQVSSQLSSRPQEGQQSDESALNSRHDEELKLPLKQIQSNLREFDKQQKQNTQQYHPNQRGSASFNSSQREETDDKTFVPQEGEAKGHKIVGLDALMPRYFDFQRAVMTRGGRRAATRGDEMPKQIDRNFWSRSRRSSLAAANGENMNQQQKTRQPQPEIVSEDDLDSFDNSMDDNNDSFSMEDDDAAEVFENADNNAHRKKLLYHQIGGGSMRSSLNTTYNEEDEEGESDEDFENQEEAKDLAAQLNPQKHVGRNEAPTPAPYHPKHYLAEENTTLDDFNSDIEEQIIKNKKLNSKKQTMEVVTAEEVERRLQIHLLRSSVEDELKKGQQQPKEKITTGNKIPYSSSKNVVDREKSSPQQQQPLIVDDDDDAGEQQEVTRLPFGMPKKQRMTISAIQNIFRNTKAQWDTDFMNQKDPEKEEEDDGNQTGKNGSTQPFNRMTSMKPKPMPIRKQQTKFKIAGGLKSMNMTAANGFGAAVALINNDNNQPSLPTRRIEIDDFVQEEDDEEF